LDKTAKVTSVDNAHTGSSMGTDCNREPKPNQGSATSRLSVTTGSCNSYSCISNPAFNILDISIDQRFSTFSRQWPPAEPLTLPWLPCPSIK